MLFAIESIYLGVLNGAFDCMVHITDVVLAARPDPADLYATAVAADIAAAISRHYVRCSV